MNIIITPRIIINKIVVFFFDKTKRNRKNDMKLFLFILVHNSLSISVSGLTMEGTVIIKVDMDERGGSINIRIIKEAGFGFDEAALNMIKLSGFSPAHSDAVFIVYPANALTHYSINKLSIENIDANDLEYLDINNQEKLDKVIHKLENDYIKLSGKI